MILDLILWQFIYLPLILAAGYPFAIQYERGGAWRVLTILAAPIALIDGYLNYTTFQLYFWEWARKDEETLSNRCKRLVFDAGWRGSIARAVARFTNRFDPTPPHIKLP